MRIIEGQSRPNSPTGASNDNWPRGSPSAAHGSIHCPGHNVRSKRTAAVRLGHPLRLAHRLSTRSPPGSPRPLERPPVTPGGSRPSREASESILILVHSAPIRSTSSPIVMVASTPCRQDHLELIQSTCALPVTGCTAAAQPGEQKGSIVQRRSALSTAL